LRYKKQSVARDGNGVIISNGTVSVFLAGTTTAASIYTSSTSTDVVNSVTTASDGSYVFYVDAFDYGSFQRFKYIVSHPDFSNTFTVDNVSVDEIVTGNYTISTAKTFSLPVEIPYGVTFTKAGSGSITVEASFYAGLYQIFSGFSAGDIVFGYTSVTDIYPNWWGLTSTGDPTTNRVSIQCAIDSAYDSVVQSQVANVRIKSGTYDLDSTAITLKSGVNVLGDGKYKTTLRSASATGSIFSSTGKLVWKLSGFDLNFTVARTAGFAILVESASSDYIIDDLRIVDPYIGIGFFESYNGTISNISILPGGPGGSVYIGFSYRGTINMTTSECAVTYGDYTGADTLAAFYIDSGNDGLWFNRCGNGAAGSDGGMVGFYMAEDTGGSFPSRWIFLQDCGIEGGGAITWANGKDGVQIISATDVHINNTYIASSARGIAVSGGNGVTISGCSIFNNGRDGISIAGGTDVKVIGNKIHNNSRETADTYYGIIVAADVNDFDIQANDVGTETNYGTVSTHIYDIAIAAGTSDNYRVIGNKVKDGSTAPFSDGGTGVNKVVSGNIGASARVFTSDDCFSGTYTPTLYNVANVAASTAYVCQYLRVGNVVTVSGQVDINVTTTALTQLGISFPIASTIVGYTQCSGTAGARNVNERSCVYGDATNTRAELTYTAVATGNEPWHFTFTYLIV